MPLPAIRNLDVFPVNYQGQILVCFRDPEGYFEEQIFLTLPAYFIAASLDGENDISDIQAAFSNQFEGHLVSDEEIRDLVNRLDQCGALQSEHFESLKERISGEFKRLDNRPAYLAGKSYPQDPKELRSFLDTFFQQEKGPREDPKKISPDGAPLRCLITPHIDFHRGGHSYAHGYLGFFKKKRPEVAFIFGVAHVGPPAPFILTRKNFETPFGLIQTDREIVESLESACESWDPYEHEIVHRTEHSIEFQAVMLSYLYGSDVRIVPILCGSFAADNPEELPEVTRFLETCRDRVGRLNGRVTVIAGADLAHIGPRFGDSFEIEPTVVQRMEGRDREDLEYVTSMDPIGFYRSVMRDQNERRVCGLNCIYSALKTVEGTARQGELIHYDHAPDPAGGVVSFANILFS